MAKNITLIYDVPTILLLLKTHFTTKRTNFLCKKTLLALSIIFSPKLRNLKSENCCVDFFEGDNYGETTICATFNKNLWLKIWFRMSSFNFSFTLHLISSYN